MFQNKIICRAGIDDSPLTSEEFDWLKKGGLLHKRILAPIKDNNFCQPAIKKSTHNLTLSDFRKRP